MFFKRTLFFIGLAGCFFPASFMPQELVNQIVAVVNDSAITLSDIQIAQAFGLFENMAEEEKAEDEEIWILEKLIDQKLIIQLSSEKVAVEEAEIESRLQDLIKRMGESEFKRRLARFGLMREDLKGYLQEKILAQKIISLKFSQTVTVSLKEIEAYYQEKYAPSLKARGLEPPAMVERLDEIEAAIKAEKIKAQVGEWLKNLKKKADIQIKLKSSFTLRKEARWVRSHFYSQARGPRLWAWAKISTNPQPMPGRCLTGPTWCSATGFPNSAWRALKKS